MLQLWTNSTLDIFIWTITILEVLFILFGILVIGLIISYMKKTSNDFNVTELTLYREYDSRPDLKETIRLGIWLSQFADKGFKVSDLGIVFCSRLITSLTIDKIVVSSITATAIHLRHPGRVFTSSTPHSDLVTK